MIPVHTKSGTCLQCSRCRDLIDLASHMGTGTSMQTYCKACTQKPNPITYTEYDRIALLTKRPWRCNASGFSSATRKRYKDLIALSGRVFVMIDRLWQTDGPIYEWGQWHHPAYGSFANWLTDMIKDNRRIIYGWRST